MRAEWVVAAFGLIVGGCCIPYAGPTYAAPELASVTDAEFWPDRAQGLGVLRQTFPIRPGMSLQAIEAQFGSSASFPSEEAPYHIALFKVDKASDCASMYCWRTPAGHDFWVTLVFEQDRVKSVWVMRGTPEIMTGIFHRILGSGPYRGDERLFRATG